MSSYPIINEWIGWMDGFYRWIIYKRRGNAHFPTLKNLQMECYEPNHLYHQRHFSYHCFPNNSMLYIQNNFINLDFWCLIDLNVWAKPSSIYKTAALSLNRPGQKLTPPRTGYQVRPPGPTGESPLCRWTYCWIRFLISALSASPSMLSSQQHRDALKAPFFPWAACLQPRRHADVGSGSVMCGRNQSA